jgi:hypothetical protein
MFNRRRRLSLGPIVLAMFLARHAAPAFPGTMTVERSPAGPESMPPHPTRA